MSTGSTDQIVLTHHREELSSPPSAHLEVRAVPRPQLADGEVRVANSHLMVSAVTADLMDPRVPLPMPAYAVGEPLWGNAVGTVTESRDPDLAFGSVVLHQQGWRAESVVSEAFAVPEGVFPGPEYVLNQGVTAYHGMVDVAQVGDGDVVLVTGAAGGVGSLAGQIAKRRGARLVIGSAGGEEKGRYLVEELGYDAAIDHRADDVEARLHELAPDGIDVLFDNVGGRQFEAAVRCAGEQARFALCGALAAQTGGPEGNPRLDVLQAIRHEVSIRPFRTLHTPQQVGAWNAAYAAWWAEGDFVFPHTVVEGDLATAVTALDEQLAGAYRGQVVVALT